MSRIDKIKNNLAIVDVKASGLMAGSFPVEIGALTFSRDGTRWKSNKSSYVVKPVPGWSYEFWDPFAESLHGLSLQTLKRIGRDVKSIASDLNAELSGKIVFSDAPEYETAWIDMVHTAADRPRAYKIYSAARMQRYIGLSDNDAYELFSSVRQKYGRTRRVLTGLAVIEEVLDLSFERAGLK